MEAFASRKKEARDQTIPRQRRISKLAGLGMHNAHTEGQGGGTTRAWKGPRGSRGWPSVSDACTHRGWGPVHSPGVHFTLMFTTATNVHSFQTLETEHMSVTDSNYRLDPARGLDSKLPAWKTHTYLLLPLNFLNTLLLTGQGSHQRESGLTAAHRHSPRASSSHIHPSPG